MFMRNIKLRSMSNMIQKSKDTFKILNDGNKIPMFGLGCYKIDRNNTCKSVMSAVRCGYRLFDTAESYENEIFVGEALKKSGVNRDNIFLVTKLSKQHGYENAFNTCMKSLKNLQVDHIDLYLIHSPSNGKILETWSAFQELQKQGHVRSIGVSNFNIHHLEGIKNSGAALPSVNQIEHHPWNQPEQLIQYCKQNNVSIMGYCPLARMKLLNDQNTLLPRLSKHHNKTHSQILLRWSIQKGVITIPKSSIAEHIEENFEIFDFELSKEDMGLIDKLNSQHQVASINAIYEPWTG